MDFDDKWRRQLHQPLNSKAFLIIGNFVYVAERTSKLAKIDIVTGEKQWTVGIPDTWGWLCMFRTNLYYMSQLGEINVIDIDSELIKNKGNIDSSFPGYIIPSSEILVSGGWRGYSDLAGYDAKTFEVLWTKNTRNKNLQKFSVPHFLNKKLLFTANHSKNKIDIIKIKDGTTRNTIALPKNISCPDLDKSFSNN